MAGQVRVEPSGILLDVADGETIMDAAERAGFRWPTICNGDARCNQCFVLVQDGAQHLSPMRPQEREGLERVRWRFGPVAHERLACQARVLGDVVVLKEGVRPLEAQEVRRHS